MIIERILDLKKKLQKLNDLSFFFYSTARWKKKNCLWKSCHFQTNSMLYYADEYEDKPEKWMYYFLPKQQFCIGNGHKNIMKRPLCATSLTWVESLMVVLTQRKDAALVLLTQVYYINLFF